MRKHLLGVVAGVSLAISASAASAVTFSFTGVNEADSQSKSFSVGGIGLTVTAGTFSSASNPSNINFSTRRVDRDPDGLGADGVGDGDQVDGSFGNDVLVFTFDQNVILESISFGNVDGNDDFAFGGVSGSSFTRIVNFQDVASSVLVSTFASPAQATGLAFGIGAIGSADNFTIKRLKVSAVSAIPLPPAMLLLGTAIIGLGAISRRRRKAAA